MLVKLIAGVETEVGEVGRYFRILSTENTGALSVRIISTSGEMYRGDVPAGLGIDFSDRTEYPKPFYKIYIKSETTQDITLWAELAKADDDRLAASATVIVSTAGKTATVPAKQTLNDINAGTEVLPALATRRTATYTISGNCFVGNKDNGIKLSAGLHAWDNKAALTLYPENTGVEFRALEEGE